MIRREAKARERRISDLELRNSTLEDCVQQFGKNCPLCSRHCNVFLATKLAEQKNASCHDGSSQKPQVSLKEPLLEILDCCLSHEERVTEVEKRCEDNHRDIR